MVTSTSSMKVPRQTATRGHHGRIGSPRGDRCVRRRVPPVSPSSTSGAAMAAPAPGARRIPTCWGGPVVEFDDLDRGLLHALQVDGRAPFRRIAEVLGVSDQTVARRYARLRSTNALRVLGLVDPTTVGDIQWSVR